MMLAMLAPRQYLPGARPRLHIFGDDEALLERGSGKVRSGTGPDNRRTNALEAVLHFYEHPTNALTELGHQRIN